MDFKDFQGRTIELSETSWQHIQEQHPDVTIDDIKRVLSDPLEVRESPRLGFVELFYQAKAHQTGKMRFHMVVVKVLSAGNFVSTAMTTATMKSGRTLYKKKDPK